jgi:hypothetical protein
MFLFLLNLQFLQPKPESLQFCLYFLTLGIKAQKQMTIT